jgi:adenylosuccinate synthase
MYDELSDDAKSFISNIEANLNVPVTLIGTGPSIKDVIDRRK